MAKARRTNEIRLLGVVRRKRSALLMSTALQATVALVLAHLDAKRASVVLMNLQGAMRVDVVRRLAEMR